MSQQKNMEFAFKAVEKGGRVKTGAMVAENERAVVLALQQQGLVPLRVTVENMTGTMKEPRASQKTPVSKAKKSRTLGPGKASALLRTELQFSFLQRVRTKDLIMFAEDLAILLESGIALNKSLSILGELTEKKRFQSVILDVHTRIREGSALHEALKAHPGVFPPVFVNMVKAGESGGVLDMVLRRLAEYLSGVQEIRDYFISAMIYPLILSLTAVGSIIVMLTFVVPKFAVIFSDLGMALPTATRIMMTMGDFLRDWWWLLLGFILALFFGLKMFIRTETGRRKWDGFKLGLPMFGTILKKIEIARFSRTLGTLLGSGVSILMAMRIVQGVVMNTMLGEKLDIVYQDLKQGRMLSRTIEKTGVFPALSVHMIGVGEETGRLDAMLNKVADIYDKELRATIKTLTSMLEPLIILAMGLVIGAMIVSMLLAIFSVNDINI